MTKAFKTSAAVLAVTIGCLGMAPRAFAAPSHVEIKVVGDSSNFFIAVKSDGPFKYDTMALAGPPRFVMDLTGASVSPAEYRLSGNGAATGVRVAQHASSPPTARIVVDLRKMTLLPITVSQDGTALSIGAVPAGFPKWEAISGSAMSDGGDEAAAKPTAPSFLKPRVVNKGKSVALEFDLSKETKPAARLEVEPDRLVIDLPGATAPAGAASFPIGLGAVRAVRATASEDGTGDLQIVVDLDVGLRHSARMKGTLLTVELQQPALKGRRIAVDAGHGDDDVGAIALDGSYEKDYNLDVAKRLAALLKKAGADVVLIRDDDRFVPLQERAARANRVKAEIFVSVHHNSLPKKPEIRGTEIYYFGNPDSRKLARTIAESMNGATQTLDRGAREARYLVLRQTHMPSVLCEIGYLTNSKDLALVKNSRFRENAARGIYNGLEEWLGGPKHQLAALEMGRGAVAEPAVLSQTPKESNVDPLDYIMKGRLKIPGAARRLVLRKTI